MKPDRACIQAEMPEIWAELVIKPSHPDTRRYLCLIHVPYSRRSCFPNLISTHTRYERLSIETKISKLYHQPSKIV